MSEIRVRDILNEITIEDIIQMLNDFLDKEGCGNYKHCKITQMTNKPFWRELIAHYGGSNIINTIIHSREFRFTDKYFYYDDDLSKFISFSTKEQLIDRISKEAIIDIVGELCFN